MRAIAGPQEVVDPDAVHAVVVDARGLQIHALDVRQPADAGEDPLDDDRALIIVADQVDDASGRLPMRTLTGRVFSRTSMPSRAKASDRICAASRSSLGRNSGRCCTMIVCAQAGRTPAPARSRADRRRSPADGAAARSGRTRSRWSGSPPRRGPGSTACSGREPVAIIAFSKRSFVPSTASASVPVKRASPKNTSTPAALSRRDRIGPADARANPRACAPSPRENRRAISAGVCAP